MEHKTNILLRPQIAAVLTKCVNLTCLRQTKAELNTTTMKN